MLGLLSIRALSGSVRWLVYPAVVCLAAAAVFASPQTAPPGEADLPSDEVMAQESVDLGRRQAVVSARLAYKDAHVGELVAGRASLADVAAAFARLNAEDPVARDMVRQAYPGRSDDERAARNVLAFVEARPTPPAERAALLTRLHAEFDRLYPPTCGGL